MGSRFPNVEQDPLDTNQSLVYTTQACGLRLPVSMKMGCSAMLPLYRAVLKGITWKYNLGESKLDKYQVRVLATKHIGLHGDGVSLQHHSIECPWYLKSNFSTMMLLYMCSVVVQLQINATKK